MRKFEQIDSGVTLAILLGRNTVKITKADGPWYEVEATTVSGRRLLADFTFFGQGEVPENVLNVMSVDQYPYDEGLSNPHVREWLKDAAAKGGIYLQHYIYAYDMDESEMFASFLGREECTEYFKTNPRRAGNPGRKEGK